MMQITLWFILLLRNAEFLIAHLKFLSIRPDNRLYYEVGFKNRSHFSIAFKRQFGVPPGGVVVSV